jgi:hypothetical protein
MTVVVLEMFVNITRVHDETTINQPSWILSASLRV